MAPEEELPIIALFFSWALVAAAFDPSILIDALDDFQANAPTYTDETALSIVINALCFLRSQPMETSLQQTKWKLFSPLYLV